MINPLNWFRRRPRPSHPSIIRHRVMWQSYLEWRDQQVCVDCGRSFTERTIEEPWATEIQCLACATEHGLPEYRGIKSARERANDAGVVF